MSDLRITTMPADRWQEYKALRLEALASDPQAFSSFHADMILKPDEYWRDRLLAADGMTSWLVFAEDEGKLVGMTGAYRKKNGTVEIVAVYVTPAWRGKGIARRLVDTILQTVCADSGVDRLSVSVNREQGPAMRLYTGSGFAVISTKEELLGDGKYHEVCLMEKSVTH